jgi:hypothetical protein
MSCKDSKKMQDMQEILAGHAIMNWESGHAGALGPARKEAA